MPTMQQVSHLIVAGAGIAGLGASLALARQGLRVTVVEHVAVVSEVGAGLQLGPNAVRVLHEWGLQDALAEVASEPQRLHLLDAGSGRLLAQLPLGLAMRQRYGWPNYTVRRADLQNVLLRAVQAEPAVAIELGQTVEQIEQQDPQQVAVHTREGRLLRADGLIGCDGVRSRVRACMRGDGAPRLTGHLAWRALLPIEQLPAGLPADQTTAWLGEQLHAVAYPVQAGRSFNVVVFTHAANLPAHFQNVPDDEWDLEAERNVLQLAVAETHPLLRGLVESVPHWRRWMMYDRPPLLDARGYAQGRVALAGDAAHPMRPHLAQGAAMGLEDGQTLARVLQGVAPADIEAALARYADLRWRRNARVQLRAQFNGMVMQASGPLRWSRDLAMMVRGAKLLDMPWLYGFQA
jgi:salicylate hydroxylase